MTNFLDRFGLSPQERRFVVIVAIVVFIVINWWVIIPMFGDWGRYEQKLGDTQKLVEKYNAEISKEPEYTRRLRELEKNGTEVPSEEAALRTQQEVVNQANLTGLGYGTITPLNRGASTGKGTNFFDEAGVNVSINTGEKELIDFLVRLADKDLLIRAKSMDIGPDPSQMRLHGNLTLVKSFQRKIVRPTTTAPTSGTPATKPEAAKTTPAASPSASTTAKTDPKTPPPVSTPNTPKPGTPATNTVPSRTLPKPVTK